MSRYTTLFFLLSILFLSIPACKNKKAEKPAERVIVTTPEEMDGMTSKVMQEMLAYAAENKGKLNDTLRLYDQAVVAALYAADNYAPVFSSKEQWGRNADSVFNFLTQARFYGLLPEQYHFEELNAIRNKIAADTNAKTDRKNAAVWARADLLFADAFGRIMQHMRKGRLQIDTATSEKATEEKVNFVSSMWKQFLQTPIMHNLVQQLEPKQEGYHALKALIPSFLENADLRPYTWIAYPNKDSIQLRTQLQARLFESGLLSAAAPAADSAILAGALSLYQSQHELKADGKIGAQTVASLNSFDFAKFNRIAITLDRFKQLPEKMPEKFIWVNIPSYMLTLWEDDSVKLVSKVVVGKPVTPTPAITSAITDMITYPQWTIPNSIIKKEILPALKKDPGYLARKGYSLATWQGEEMDPYTIDWSKYEKEIPYKIVQGSGDDNALGVLKFNFPSKTMIYLHDTNQRYFFDRTMRSLSHGCVRVQKWDKLASYILANDSIQSELKGKFNYTLSDSLNTWLARKEKHVIPVRYKIPIYIRYFSCEAKDGKIIFYDDIYGEDRALSEKYLTHS